MRKNILPVILLIPFIFSACASGRFSNYITADKDKLMDGDKELRFVSFNTPNLHYIEDYLAFDAASPWRLPDEFEIRDALTTIKHLGGKVTRTYVLSVRKPGESKKIIRHVEGPGKFNEEAFRALDKVLQIANETGIRVILPLVDNWWWWGGPAEYAAFRGKKKEEFWTDRQLIDDFKKTVEFIVNRRNTYTGILYKEDKALLGWETGNELECPFAWNDQIAAYIKSMDKNHLVIEGTYSKLVSPEAIQSQNIDVLSTHHYGRAEEAVKFIKQNKELSKGKKPYFVGEFGLVPVSDIRTIVDSAVNADVSGIMIWSLRFRNRNGGFYLHRENTGSGPYRYPGFTSGDVYSEKEIIKYMREKAYEINSELIPSDEVPAAPNLLEINNVHSISWQGSVGAVTYNVERREKDKEIWETVGENISEGDAGYKPLFADTTAQYGTEYYYRVTAKNAAGSSEPSNESGPVMVNSLMMIDEMGDDSHLYSKAGNIEFPGFKDIYKAKEDNTRLKADSSSYIIYAVPENISCLRLYSFMDNPEAITVSASSSAGEYTPILTRVETHPPYKNAYGFFTPVFLCCEEFPPDTRFIKINFNSKAQLARTEIEYTK